MPLIDHNHTHQWERIGVIGEKAPFHEPEIIYLCSECDAWTTLELSDTSRVPFRSGELASGSGGNEEP